MTKLSPSILLVEGNRELIKIYEEKIKKVIERVWEGEVNILKSFCKPIVGK